MAKVTLPDNIKNLKREAAKEIDTGKRIDEQLLKPGKYELSTLDDFRIEFFLFKKENRWIVSETAVDKDISIEKHWVDFRMWSYEEDIFLRKQATSYDSAKKIHFVDNDLLNRIKIQQLLKAWSLDTHNVRLKLLHVQGVLADESYVAFIGLYPNIVRYIIDRMNSVLEYNG